MANSADRLLAGTVVVGAVLSGAAATGASSVGTSTHCGSGVLRLARVPVERPHRVAPVVPVRPAVVLLHRALTSKLDLGLDERLSDQATDRHLLLLRLFLLRFPADDSTMPG
jgi:hypothetical protein